MPGRTNRSARVVLCDDVSWSEPTPRRARSGSELTPPRSLRSGSADADRRRDLARVEGYLEDDRWATDVQTLSEADLRASARTIIRTDARGQTASAPAPLGSHVADWLEGYAEEFAPEGLAAVNAEHQLEDDEQIWGPRPKLMATETGGRRTVVITGHGAEGHPARRSPQRETGLHRSGIVADRTAMWAVLLCVILLLVALTSH